MAARLNPKHDEKTRLEIQGSQLINRLQDFALGKNDPQGKKPALGNLVPSNEIGQKVACGFNLLANPLGARHSLS